MAQGSRVQGVMIQSFGPRVRSFLGSGFSLGFTGLGFRDSHRQGILALPIGSIVASFWDYLIGS